MVRSAIPVGAPAVFLCTATRVHMLLCAWWVLRVVRVVRRAALQLIVWSNGFNAIKSIDQNAYI